MSGDSQEMCLDRWMDAGLQDGDWTAALDASMDFLKARAAVLACGDAGATLHLHASHTSPGAFTAQCRQLAEHEAAGLNRRDAIVHERRFQGLGDIAWISRGGEASVSSPTIWIFALADGGCDPVTLRSVAAAARNSFAVRARLGAMHASSGLKTAGFDQMPFGVAIVDECLRITEMNEGLQAILARGDGFCVLQGRLICRESRDQAALARLALTAIRGVSGVMVRVARGLDAPPYVVRAISRRAEPGAKAAHCLLMIVDPDATPPRGVDIWRTLFDLTECELAVAEGLVSGLRISDVAEQRGVSVETVRTQTKRMFERLNVTSQAEAAARLIRTAPFRPALSVSAKPTLAMAGA